MTDQPPTIATPTQRRHARHTARQHIPPPPGQTLRLILTATTALLLTAGCLIPPALAAGIPLAAITLILTARAHPTEQAWKQAIARETAAILARQHLQ